jgi:hypothetical protein
VSHHHYHKLLFTCYSVVTNVIFNTCFGSIICHIGKFNFKDNVLNFHFELFRENCMKIITTGQIFLSNYKLSMF